MGLRGSRRFPGACMWLAGVGVTLLAVSAARADERPAIAVLPLNAGWLPQETVQLLQELLTNELDRYGIYRVTGASDINALLGLERMRDMAGCEDVACAAEIGGALGVRYLLAATIGRLGGNLVVALKILDIKSQAVESRAEETVPDDEGAYARGLRSAVARLLGRAPQNGPALLQLAPGRIEITTAPSGARCILDGKLVGETPCVIQAVPPGTYQVRLVLPGFEPRDETIVVAPGRVADRQVGLEPLPISVEILSDPLGAEVFLDDARIGTTPITRPLAPGSYALRLMLANHRPFASRLALAPSAQPRVLSAALEALPSRLAVKTVPPGAKVRALPATASDTGVGGVRTLSAPLSVVQTAEKCTSDCELTVPPGVYLVEVEHNGFENVAQQLTLGPGAVDALEVKLVPGYSDPEKQLRAWRLGWAIGLSAAAAGGGAVFAWQGLDAQAAADRLRGATWGDSARATMNRGRSAAVAADVSLAVGTAAALVATYFWVRWAL